MKSELLELLRSRTFLAFFFTQFFGAFNDNLFKTALSLVIAFTAVERSQSESSILINLAAILFILPFFLLSPRAGEAADRNDKVILIRRIKLVEILLMTAGAVGFYFGNTWFLLLVLFLMGSQSTFFGPLKYSYLPELLAPQRLVGANALIQASTFIGIILGMILAGVLFTVSDQHLTWVWTATLVTAAVGYLSSRLMTRAGTPAAQKTLHTRGFIALIRLARTNRDAWRAILGISWFWLVGATYITQLPNFVRFQLYADEQVFLFCLTLFAFGIGMGAMLCSALKQTRLGDFSVSLGLAGLLLSGLLVSQLTLAPRESLLGLAEFLQQVNPLLGFGLLMLGVSGGLYIVPLYTVLQLQSDNLHRSRMIAVNNIMNASFMVIAAALALVLLGGGMTISELFFWLALANLALAGFLASQNHRLLLRVRAFYQSN